jgi:chitin synthase
MGIVMIAALLEWFLWLAAFIYCLVKVYQKAEKWHIRVLAVIMMVLFSAFRYVNVKKEKEKSLLLMIFFKKI